MFDWFLYECAKCDGKTVHDRAGGKLNCGMEPCTASADQVTFVALVPDGQPKTLASLIGGAVA